MLSIVPLAVLNTLSLYRYEKRYAQDKQEQAEVMRRHEVQLEEMRERIEKEMNEKLELKTAELERSQKGWFGGKKAKAAQEELARLQKEKEQQLAQAEQEKNAYLEQQRRRQEAKEKEHVEELRVMEAKEKAIEAKEAAERKAMKEAEERKAMKEAADQAQKSFLQVKVRGSLQVEVKGKLFGSSWSEVDGEYNPATREFSSTDSKGKQQRVADCWVVDVLNREGKKQHRFNVVSNTQGTLVALAAAGEAEKQRWLAAMEAGTVAVHTIGASVSSSRSSSSTVLEVC
jgi:hypothetical protein